jgi:hypothetical protein
MGQRYVREIGIENGIKWDDSLIALGSREEAEGVVGLFDDFSVAADVRVRVVNFSVPPVGAAGLDDGRIGLAPCRVVFGTGSAAGIKWDWRRFGTAFFGILTSQTFS